MRRARSSPNHVLTHAARAAASLQAPLVAARGAREGLWLEQRAKRCPMTVGCISLQKAARRAHSRLTGLTTYSVIARALSAKIEINHCSIKNIFQNVYIKITTDFLMNCPIKIAAKLSGFRR